MGGPSPCNCRTAFASSAEFTHGQEFYRQFILSLLVLSCLQICYKILASLPTSELRICGQVSHSWSSKIAAFVSGHHECCGCVNKSCKEIVRLSRLVQAINHCLVNSLKIHLPLDHSKRCHFLPAAREMMAVRNNISKLQVRSLDLLVGSCEAADALIKEILIASRSNLERLTIAYCVRVLILFLKRSYEM